MEFFRTLFSCAGLPQDAYRQNFLQRRFKACLRCLGVKDAAAARQKVLERPELAGVVLNVVLLGVTAFYRDAHVFDHLRDVIIPFWQREGVRPRIWSAACSDGQELYSVAMLLARVGLLENAELLGTDCRAEAVARARVGRFSIEAQAQMQEMDAGYYDHESSSLHFRKLLRSVAWRQADLLREAEPGPWDLILWRNMSIYLERPAASEIWKALEAQLRPGAFLIGGKADYPPPGLRLSRVAPCVFRKEESSARS